MKIAVLGASGWIGSNLAREVQERGHQLVALVREPSKVSLNAEVRQVDSQDRSALLQALADIEVLIVSIGGRASGAHQIVPNTAKTLLNLLPDTSVQRLLWVGGAGSLEVAPGQTLLSLPSFPEEYKGEAQAQGEALQVFRTSNSQVDWLFVSPAAEIFPGQRTGQYRLGGDQLLTDNEGHSRISVEDYAKALLDEVEAKRYQRQRIGVAY
ncbi:NAD(P)-dependent oxidoreductase [Balneatrix alpica]|uniref:NAD(P)-dependent oxidoreductase n=1 Tax=Balneatrix alpica TaxID=75684 RepID=UPI00273A06C5|nr:NAD(P)-dependent oxidoreductase [Balneatrix alpica]